MAPIRIHSMSSGSKKTEPRYTRLSEAKASPSQRMWVEVSSSAPHLLHDGLSDSPIRWRYLLRVLRPVRRPVTTLDCVLLKDRNLALAPRQGPEFSSRSVFGCRLVVSYRRFKTTSLDCLKTEDGIDRLSRNVCNDYQSTLRKIQVNRRSDNYLHQKAVPQDAFWSSSTYFASSQLSYVRHFYKLRVTLNSTLNKRYSQWANLCCVNVDEHVTSFRKFDYD
jgi:hypothetical protein